jgi:hypothetical protein
VKYPSPINDRPEIFDLWVKGYLTPCMLRLGFTLVATRRSALRNARISSLSRAGTREPPPRQSRDDDNFSRGP